MITRDLGSLDYFASASYLCRAYASLADLTRRPGLSPIGQVLSHNDAGLDLDPAQWKTTWYKGGYESRAWTLAYLATTRTERSYVVTVLAEDRSQPSDGATAPRSCWRRSKGLYPGRAPLRSRSNRDPQTARRPGSWAGIPGQPVTAGGSRPMGARLSAMSWSGLVVHRAEDRVEQALGGRVPRLGLNV